MTDHPLEMLNRETGQSKAAWKVINVTLGGGEVRTRGVGGGERWRIHTPITALQQCSGYLTVRRKGGHSVLMAPGLPERS